MNQRKNQLKQHIHKRINLCGRVSRRRADHSESSQWRFFGQEGGNRRRGDMVRTSKTEWDNKNCTGSMWNKTGSESSRKRINFLFGHCRIEKTRKQDKEQEKTQQAHEMEKVNRATRAKLQAYASQLSIRRTTKHKLQETTMSADSQSDWVSRANCSKRGRQIKSAVDTVLFFLQRVSVSSWHGRLTNLNLFDSRCAKDWMS